MICERIIELVDNKGSIERFTLLQIIEYQDRKFAAMKPNKKSIAGPNETVIISELYEVDEDIALIYLEDKILAETIFQRLIEITDEVGCDYSVYQG